MRLFYDWWDYPMNVLSNFSDEEIRTAVNELTKRGFLFEIEKPYGCVYGINKLRIANMKFIYWWGEQNG